MDYVGGYDVFSFVNFEPGFRFRGGQCDAELTLCAEADHDYGHVVLAATLVGEIDEPVGG